MKRKATILFAVTLAGNAAADPWQPRTLPSGQPAAGNVFCKCVAPVQTVDFGGTARDLASELAREGEKLRAPVSAALATIAHTVDGPTGRDVDVRGDVRLAGPVPSPRGVAGR
jgi:hypothetical protein